MTDAKKLQYYLDSPLMKRIVELKERDFADKDKFDYAPVSYDDAIENYKRIVEITERWQRTSSSLTLRALTSKAPTSRTTA